jgi:hypothetical protein
MLRHLRNWFLSVWLFLVLDLRFASTLDVFPSDFGAVAFGSCRQTPVCADLRAGVIHASGLAAALVLHVSEFSGSLAASRC